MLILNHLFKVSLAVPAASKVVLGGFWPSLADPRLHAKRTLVASKFQVTYVRSMTKLLSHYPRSLHDRWFSEYMGSSSIALVLSRLT